MTKPALSALETVPRIAGTAVSFIAGGHDDPTDDSQNISLDNWRDMLSGGAMGRRGNAIEALIKGNGINDRLYDAQDTLNLKPGEQGAYEAAFDPFNFVGLGPAKKIGTGLQRLAGAVPDSKVAQIIDSPLDARRIAQLLDNGSPTRAGESLLQASGKSRPLTPDDLSGISVENRARQLKRVPSGGRPTPDDFLPLSDDQGADIAARYADQIPEPPARSTTPPPAAVRRIEASSPEAKAALEELNAKLRARFGENAPVATAGSDMSRNLVVTVPAKAEANATDALLAEFGLEPAGQTGSRLFRFKADAPPPRQIGQGQIGMGIGEDVQQGQLLGEFKGTGGAVPLANADNLAAQAARRDEIARGQQVLPEQDALSVAAAPKFENWLYPITGGYGEPKVEGAMTFGTRTNSQGRTQVDVYIGTEMVNRATYKSPSEAKTAISKFRDDFEQQTPGAQAARRNELTKGQTDMFADDVTPTPRAAREMPTGAEQEILQLDNRIAEITAELEELKQVVRPTKDKFTVSGGKKGGNQRRVVSERYVKIDKLTTPELRALAKEIGVDPTKPGWFDSLDGQLIDSKLAERAYNPAPNRNVLLSERVAARKRIKAIETEAPVLPAADGVIAGYQLDAARAKALRV
jgi:hypothetical protein